MYILLLRTNLLNHDKVLTSGYLPLVLLEKPNMESMKHSNSGQLHPGYLEH